MLTAMDELKGYEEPPASGARTGPEHSRGRNCESW